MIYKLPSTLQFYKTNHLCQGTKEKESGYSESTCMDTMEKKPHNYKVKRSVRFTLRTHLKRTPLITCQALGCCWGCCCWGSCAVATVWASWPEGAAPLLLTCTEHSVMNKMTMNIYYTTHCDKDVRQKDRTNLFSIVPLTTVFFVLHHLCKLCTLVLVI